MRMGVRRGARDKGRQVLRSRLRRTRGTIAEIMVCRCGILSGLLWLSFLLIAVGS